MRWLRGSFVAVLVIGATGCGSSEDSGPDHVSIVVEDHADALTSNPSDKLFILTLSKSPKSYALADVVVYANLPGQTANQLDYTHDDGNGNGKLDVGESLQCSEPPLNIFDATTVGKSVVVGFAVPFQGTMTEVGTATWNPVN